MAVLVRQINCVGENSSEEVTSAILYAIVFGLTVGVHGEHFILLLVFRQVRGDHLRAKNSMHALGDVGYAMVNLQIFAFAKPTELTMDYR